MIKYNYFNVLIKKIDIEKIKSNYYTKHIGSDVFSFTDEFTKVVFDKYGSKQITFEELQELASGLGYDSRVDYVNRSLKRYYRDINRKVENIIKKASVNSEPKYINLEQENRCIFLDCELTNVEYETIYESHYVEGLTKNAIVFKNAFYSYLEREIKNGKCIELVLFEAGIPLSILKNKHIFDDYYFKTSNLSSKDFVAYSELRKKIEDMERERDDAIDLYIASQEYPRFDEVYSKAERIQMGKNQIEKEIASLKKELQDGEKKRSELNHISEKRAAIFFEVKYREEELKGIEHDIFTHRISSLIDKEILEEISRINSLEELSKWEKEYRGSYLPAFNYNRLYHEKELELKRLQNIFYINSDFSYELYALEDYYKKKYQINDRNREKVYDLQNEIMRSLDDINELSLKAKKKSIENTYILYFHEKLSYDDIKEKYYTMPESKEQYPKHSVESIHQYWKIRDYNDIEPYKVVIEMLDLKKHEITARTRNQIIKSQVQRALEADPFLELYIDESDEETLNMLRNEPCISKKKIRISCPYCGAVKYHRIIDIVNKHPKCEICNDGNIEYDEIELPDIPYIVAKRG